MTTTGIDHGCIHLHYGPTMDDFRVVQYTGWRRLSVEGAWVYVLSSSIEEIEDERGTEVINGRNRRTQGKDL